MAEAANNPTMMDLASRLDPQGNIMQIAEVLAKSDPILKLMRWQECNKTDGYVHAIRTGLPAVTWRKLYQGVQPSKSTTTQVTDTCGNLEAYAEVDIDLANLNGNTAMWRMSEQKPFIAAMGNEMAKTIFYGDTDVEPERFMGIAPRYNTLKKTVPISRNVVNAGGTTDGQVTSIFIISLDQFKGIYPKGSQVGLQHKDLGQTTKVNEDKSMYEIYRDHYKWQAGTMLSDWRGCVRICNIPVVDGQIAMETKALIHKLIEGKNRIPAALRTNLHMFCAEEVKTALEISALEYSNNVLKIVEAAEQFKTHFFDIPIEVSDSVSLAEKLVK